MVRYGGPVGPVGHRPGEQAGHRRRIVVGQVLVDRARGDGPRADQGRRRERVRVVEHGDLGDHPAHADARHVRGPGVERAGQRRGVGGEIAQRVRRCRGIHGRGRAAVAQVVAHDVPSPVGERRAELVGPREHGRAADEQDRRTRRVAEVLDPECDVVGLRGRHETHPGTCGTDGRGAVACGVRTGGSTRLMRVQTCAAGGTHRPSRRPAALRPVHAPEIALSGLEHLRQPPQRNLGCTRRARRRRAPRRERPHGADSTVVEWRPDRLQ